MILDITTITLLVLLATKLTVDAAASESFQRMSRFLSLPVISFLMLFALIVALRVKQILA